MIREKEIMNALMTLTMMFFLNVIKITGDCPRYCECKWKSGKESVLCTNANMTEIPKHLDSGTQLLDLTGNRLQSIGPDEFFNASLLNLQKIFLSRCRLRFIERSSFRKIINLVELDLSYNELHSVPSHTFEFITELRELRLNGNPIIRVLNNAFKMVPRLTKLDLSECRIGYVEIKAFQGLETSLEWLKLDKNKIMNIKPFALINLGNLHGLELSGNPWNCSCGLRTLREWMLRQNVPYSIPPVCKYPSRLADKDWDKLDLDEFACAPRIEAASSLKSGEEGSNVTMSCTVHGNPEPRIRWLRKNHPIVNSTASANLEKPKLYVVQIAKESSNLTILAADVQDNGVYVCRAENKAGKSEANITLTVTMKPVVRIWSSRMIAAVGVVSLLFAVAVGLLTFCAWSSRKRKFDFGHPVGGRDYDADGYEMSHKKPINYNKIVDYGNHYRSNSTTDTSRIPGKNSRTGSLNERTIETSQEGNNQVRDFFASQSSGSGSRDERIWDSLKASDVEDRLSESSNSRPSPDLHIPRLNEHESHRNSPKACKANNFLEDSSTTYTMASSKGFLSFNPNVEPRFSHSDKAPDGTQRFYTSQPKPRTQTHVKYPDLLELSKNTENLLNNNNNNHSHKNNNNNNNNNNNSINNNNNNNNNTNINNNNNNNNSFCTMPRKRSYKMKKNRHGSYGSESQSPLLPGSSGDSCDSNFSSSRRPSIELDGISKNASLPASPGNLNQPSIFNGFDVVNGSSDFSEKSPKTLKYKSWELEKFLKEYRSLQDQLCKMKESCENLNEEALRYRESEGGSIAAGSAAISKLISYATTSEPERGANGKFTDDTHNADAFHGKATFALEDNNNPKSILKSKKPKSQTETATVGEMFWSRDRKMLKTLTEPNSENSLYQS